MYKAYERSKDMPVFSTFLYMFILKFSAGIALLILLSQLLGEDNTFIEFTRRQPLYFFIPFALVIVILNFILYFKKDVSYFEEKFPNIKTNTSKIVFLSFLPVITFFGSIALILIVSDVL